VTLKPNRSCSEIEFLIVVYVRSQNLNLSKISCSFSTCSEQCLWKSLIHEFKFKTGPAGGRTPPAAIYKGRGALGTNLRSQGLDLRSPERARNHRGLLPTGRYHLGEDD
jgi:hypothetical protein